MGSGIRKRRGIGWERGLVTAGRGGGGGDKPVLPPRLNRPRTRKLGPVGPSGKAVAWPPYACTAAARLYKEEDVKARARRGEAKKRPMVPTGGAT